MISMARVEVQLNPVVGEDRATLLASLAGGIEGVLRENPMFTALMATEVFPALAVLYASALRTANIAADSPVDANDPNDGRSRDAAVKTRKEMAAIIEAVVNAPVELTPPSLGLNPIAVLMEQLRRQAEAMTANDAGAPVADTDSDIEFEPAEFGDEDDAKEPA